MYTCRPETEAALRLPLHVQYGKAFEDLNIVCSTTMNGEGSYTLEVPFSHPPLRLLADYSATRHARQPHRSASTESSISTRWRARLAANPALFNASKFRYAGARVDADARTVTVRLGLTDYKTFQGTHGAPDALATFGRQGLARPMGNAVAVETADAFVPFLVRCGAVGEGAGRACMPGGHAEPAEVGIGGEGEEGEGVSNEAVAAELSDAARREVLEELFVPEGEVGMLRFLGIVARDVDAKALIAFTAKVGMSAEEVRQSYVAANGKQEESTRVIFVPVAKLGDVCKEEKVEGAPLMPDHVGALALAVEFFRQTHGT